MPYFRRFYKDPKKIELQSDTIAALYLAKAGHIDLLKEDLIKFKNYRLNGVLGW